jgi:hypothetical protein
MGATITNDPISRAEYHLALAVIRQTLLDALNGYGAEHLAALFYPMAQSALQILLDADPEHTMRRTLIACQQLIELSETDRSAIHRALVWNGFEQIYKVMSDVEIESAS